MTATPNQTRKLSLQVTGMTCAGCAATVEKALTDVDGVSQANVNLASEKAAIEYDPAETEPKELVNAVWSTGYGVATEKATFRVGAMACASCAATIETSLSELPGVISVNVNLASEKATVEFLPGEATRSDFKKAVEGAGYQFLENGKTEAMKISFAVTGMTCASCVSHVESALRQVDGVISANANLASERATVEYDVAKADMDSFKQAVEKAGYGIAAVVSEETPVTDVVAEGSRREIRILRNKLIFAGIIGVYMLLVAVSEFAGSWLPSVFSNKYLLWVLATPVQFWAGWQFYRGTWGALKHKTANMNTLIAVGTSAAYFYSVTAILFPGFFAAGGREANVYFDTAVVIVALILFGRFLEARAKGQTSEAIKKLMGMQAKTARVVRNGTETDIPIQQVTIGDIVIVRPGEKVPVDGIVKEGH